MSARTTSRDGAAKVSAADVTGAEFGDVLADVSSRRLKGFDTDAIELSISLSRLAGVHSQESERRATRPRGLSVAAFRVLYIVWTFDNVEARHIARLAGVSRQTTSTVLANLERSGLVARERSSETDRRLVDITLTDLGRTTIEESLAEQNRLESKWFSVLTPAERHTLKALMDRITEQINKTGD